MCCTNRNSNVSYSHSFQIIITVTNKHNRITLFLILFNNLFLTKNFCQFYHLIVFNDRIGTIIFTPDFLQ